MSKTREHDGWTLVETYEAKNTVPRQDNLGIFHTSFGGTIKIWTIPAPMRTECICYDPAKFSVMIEFADKSFEITRRCKTCLKNMIGRRGGG